MIANTLAVVPLAAFCGLLVYAAVSDLLTYTIPNRISLALIAAFVVHVPLAGLGAFGVAMHLGAGATVLAVCFAMFAFGWIGGGDAKLAAAIGLWFGFADLPSFLLIAAISGGLLSVAIVALRALPLPIVIGDCLWLQRLQDKRSGIPYGIALAAGALFALPHTAIWRTVTGI